MAVALVQKNLATGTATTVVTTLAGVAVGNLLVFGVTSDTGTHTLSSLTITSNANATISANSPADNGGARAWIAYLLSVVTGGSLTFTATLSGSANACSIWVREFSGFGGGTFHSDIAGTGTGTTVNTPSVTNTAGDLLYAVAFEAGSITNTGSPWAALDSPTQIQNGEADEYILSSSGSSQAVNWATSSAAWAAMAASFTPAGGAIKQGWPIQSQGPSFRI